MNAGQLRATLSGLGVVPSRRWGQNFLLDSQAAAAIAGALEAGPGDFLVEIGPGTGALTEHLTDRGRFLLLLEKDERLAAYLASRWPDPDTVRVVSGDATEYDVRALFPQAPVKVIGNLPYSCGTEILRRFLAPPSPVASAVFMLQQEVCDRLTASPRTKDYGVLTLRVQAHWQIRRLRQVGPGSFHPRPQVDSGVIRIDPLPAGTFPPFDARLFDRLIRQGFSQRRKQLKNLLGLPEEQWPELCSALRFPETVRGEELDVATWIELTRLLDDHPLKHLPQRGDECFDVVDADDQVVGRATRDDVHRQRLFHRAVHVFVFNRQGELFLQKRSLLKDTHPGAWDSSASGHLDAGEAYPEAVVRELREELGLEPGPVEELAALPPSEETGWEHVRLFRTQATGRIRFPCSEIEHGAFFPLGLIRDWVRRRPQDFAGGFRLCLEHLPSEPAS